MFQNLEELLIAAPRILDEMTAEFVRVTRIHINANRHSQRVACCLLAIRSVSLLRSMGLLLRPPTLDGHDVLIRSFLESRDLLTTFRFDNDGARKQIHSWFAGKDGWKPRHKVCEEFIEKISGKDPEFARRWGIFSGLSHPTARATENSAALIGESLMHSMQEQEILEMLRPKVADYVTNVASLIFAATFDAAGWVSLECDLSHMPTIESFRLDTAAIAIPILKAGVPA